MTKLNQQLTPNKVIGLDMDGVIIDHTDLKIRLAKEQDLELLPHETASDVLERIVPAANRRVIKDLIYSNPALSLQAPLVEGAKDGLSALRKGGLRYYLISRRKNAELATELLKLRGLWPNYFNETNAYFVLTPEDKNVKSEELGITHYVDDEVGVLAELSSVRNRFLFDPYWVLEEGDYTRIKSWAELVKHLLA